MIFLAKNLTTVNSISESTQTQEIKPPSVSDDLTPSRRQYLNLKNKNPDAILFFRMGDFYETFDDDARVISAELGLALTSRPMGKSEGRIPLAGIPYHQLDRYLDRLLNAGYKVAIAEQVSEPGKGLVERRIVRVVTPGTVDSDSLFTKGVHNWLCSIISVTDSSSQTTLWGFAACDVTTGEIEMQMLTDEGLLNELSRLRPSELIIPPKTVLPSDQLFKNIYLTVRPSEFFVISKAKQQLTKLFKDSIEQDFNDIHMAPALGAVGSLVSYLEETWDSAMANLRYPVFIGSAQFMVIDAQTQKNLEIFSSSESDRSNGSLLNSIDNTLTAMGKRLLIQRLGRPLLDTEALETRLNQIQTFTESTKTRDLLRHYLIDIPDVERLISRIRGGPYSARDLVKLRFGLEKIVAIDEVLSVTNQRLSDMSLDNLSSVTEILSVLQSGINDDPPVDLSDGGTIRAGYSKEIDSLRLIASSEREKLSDLELLERQRTGLQSLKIGYHRVHGYYLELSKSQSQDAPEEYVPRQTLASSQRFGYAPLDSLEKEILSSVENLLTVEQGVLEKIGSIVTSASELLLAASKTIAVLDVTASLAQTAVDYEYVRPLYTEAGSLEIIEGRHPVLEQSLELGYFIPNDISLGLDADIVLLTGPNMGGKSTYLRQVALIFLLAQCGSFVPAKRATIPLRDRIFSRVGAQDNLSAGQSTFMVEMLETAVILNKATENSLVLLDEVGRGTSTYDGLAIAQATIEHLHNSLLGTPLTLFATHYRELTEIVSTLDRIKNCSVSVKETPDGYVFLHQIIEGSSDRSYGIHVAKLAGLPSTVVLRAAELVKTFEASNDSQFQALEVINSPVDESNHESEIFNLAKKIAELDLDHLSPIEALQELYELQLMSNRSLKSSQHD